MTTDRPTAGETHECPMVAIYTKQRCSLTQGHVGECNVPTPRINQPEWATRPPATEPGPLAEHVEQVRTQESGLHHCIGCHMPWPCDVSKLATALAASQARVGELEKALHETPNTDPLDIRLGIARALLIKSESESARLREEVEGLTKIASEKNSKAIDEQARADKAETELTAHQESAGGLLLDAYARANKAEAQLAEARENVDEYQKLAEEHCETIDQLQKQLAAVQGELAEEKKLSASYLREEEWQRQQRIQASDTAQKLQAEVASLQADKAAALFLISHYRGLGPSGVAETPVLDAKRRLGL